MASGHEENRRRFGIVAPARPPAGRDFARSRCRHRLAGQLRPRAPQERQCGGLPLPPRSPQGFHPSRHRSDAETRGGSRKIPWPVLADVRQCSPAGNPFRIPGRLAGGLAGRRTVPAAGNPRSRVPCWSHPPASVALQAGATCFQASLHARRRSYRPTFPPRDSRVHLLHLPGHAGRAGVAGEECLSRTPQDLRRALRLVHRGGPALGHHRGRGGGRQGAADLPRGNPHLPTLLHRYPRRTLWLDSRYRAAGGAR